MGICESIRALGVRVRDSGDVLRVEDVDEVLRGGSGCGALGSLP